MGRFRHRGGGRCHHSRCSSTRTESDSYTRPRQQFHVGEFRLRQFATGSGRLSGSTTATTGEWQPVLAERAGQGPHNQRRKPLYGIETTCCNDLGQSSEQYGYAPPPSFRDLQAQDEASGCLQASGADVSLPALSTQDRPNPRVVSGLQEMGFEAQLCGAAALSTGNESLEKAARWLADALEQHAHARSAGGKRQPHRHEESDTNGLGASAQAMPASPRAIGFVDKLAAAIASSQASGSATNENEAMEEDGWEVVSKVAQE